MYYKPRENFVNHPVYAIKRIRVEQPKLHVNEIDTKSRKYICYTKRIRHRVSSTEKRKVQSLTERKTKHSGRERK
jgi:hypothetical protein